VDRNPQNYYNYAYLEAPMPPIRILSVEDHPVFREGLRTIISCQPDMVLVAQAATAVEAMAEFKRCRPDVTLMDIRLPGTNGTDALIAIRGEYPQARIIMLTTSDSDGEIQRAMRAGAAAYILNSYVKELKAAGYDRRAAVAIALAAGARTLVNTVAHLSRPEIDAGFQPAMADSVGQA